MRPNEIKHVHLDNKDLRQYKEIIETSAPASVSFAVTVGYETNGAEKVPLYFHVFTPDKGLASDFCFALSLHSLQTGQIIFQEVTSRGSQASRKVVAHVNPHETWVLRVTKPKTGFFARWLLGKPKLWLYVGAYRSSRQYDAIYAA